MGTARVGTWTERGRDPNQGRVKVDQKEVMREGQRPSGRTAGVGDAVGVEADRARGAGSAGRGAAPGTYRRHLEGSPIIRLQSRWAPSPAIKMLIGPGSPAEPRLGPPGRMLVPAPTSDLSGCGSVIRGRPRPAPAPREHLPRKMNVPPLPRPGSRATKRACYLRRLPEPGLARIHPARLRGGDAGGSGAPRRRRRGAELSTLRAPPPARPRVARPPAARFRPRTRSPRAATGARASGSAAPGAAPAATPRPWSPGKWAAWGPEPPVGAETMAEPNPKRGRMSPRGHCAARTPRPAPARPTIGHRPNVMGAANPGRAAAGRVSAWLRAEGGLGEWGELQPRRRAENHR